MDKLEIGTAGPIVVIGAGASGVLTAAAMLRSGHKRVVLVERDGSWSTGPAYATGDPHHLLNVPAGKLSADSARPFDFVEWAFLRVPGVTPHSFLPRRLYGEYLRSHLDASTRRARPGALARITAEATTLHRVRGHGGESAGVRVAFRDGRSIVAAHVALALGNPPSRALACDHGTVIDDPWSVCSSDVIPRDDSIIIVGSGLTAVDVALTLASRNHRGAIRMVSRHGLLPRAHDTRPTHPSPRPGAAAPKTARAALAWIRAAITEADGDWRAVFDAIRPRTNELWHHLPEEERARLLRHAGRYWEVHRHRIAPEVAREVERLFASGRLEISSGGVTGDARWVINCTGPNFDLRASRSPLIRNLFDTGMARPGPLGLGLDADAAGSLIGRSGLASPTVSVVGPLRRGADWETTAIPDIRTHAEALALRVREHRHATRSRRRRETTDRAPAPAGAIGVR